MFSSYDDECPFCGARIGEPCLKEDAEDDCFVALWEERDPDAERQQREDDRMDREQDR